MGTSDLNEAEGEEKNARPDAGVTKAAPRAGDLGSRLDPTLSITPDEENRQDRPNRHFCSPLLILRTCRIGLWAASGPTRMSPEAEEWRC
ncbi:hypothetical protein VTN96DRAFT_8543 [Rasamsonia emersonii]